METEWGQITKWHQSGWETRTEAISLDQSRQISEPGGPEVIDQLWNEKLTNVEKFLTTMSDELICEELVGCNVGLWWNAGESRGKNQATGHLSAADFYRV